MCTHICVHIYVYDWTSCMCNYRIIYVLHCTHICVLLYSYMCKPISILIYVCRKNTYVCIILVPYYLIRQDMSTSSHLPTSICSTCTYVVSTGRSSLCSYDVYLCLFETNGSITLGNHSARNPTPNPPPKCLRTHSRTPPPIPLLQPLRRTHW